VADPDRPVAIEVFVHRRTLGDRGALLVSLQGDVEWAVWIPRSQVIDEERARASAAGRSADVGAYATVLTVPHWLIVEKGLDAGARPKGIADLFGGGV